MRSSSAHTSAIRPEITIRPAHDGATPASYSLTILRRLGDVRDKAFLVPVLQGFGADLAASGCGGRIFPATVSRRGAGACIFRPGIAELFLMHEEADGTGTNRAISECNGDSNAASIGVREK
jgi:hypothetical protein